MRAPPALILVLLFAGCVESPRSETATPSEAPAWASEAIWYQVFVERFRNGDPTNDPTREDIVGSYPGFIPDGWSTTEWTWDWYRPDQWFAAMDGLPASDGSEVRTFSQKAQLRRYGGDLQGVLDKVDYLDSLGVNAIYFNPLNDAASLHKFDARNWRHIDRNFGPTPQADVETMASEVPHDPSTWQWTGADQMFLELVDQLHERGIRVILDYSWNHTGQVFWAFEDVAEKGAASEYSDWYWIESFDNPETPENEFDYRGWFGVRELPEIKEDVFHDASEGIGAYEGNILSAEAKEHIYAVTRRWLDPNGDGDLSDGVDGFRLDVAAEIGLGFWREYRDVVKSVNPDAYLVGEVWWEQWPDRLADPSPFLQGDVFDAVMNYRWYRSTRRFFNEAPEAIPVSQFVDSLESYKRGVPVSNQYAMMNMAASHDTPRVLTSLFNSNQYKVGTSALGGSDYKIHRPDQETFRTLDLLLAHQFTYVGAPQIWAGDEMGMWGSDDPDTRKPLIWPDYEFQDEVVHPTGQARPVDEVSFDRDLFDRYRHFIQIRKDHPVLSTGELEHLVIDDQAKTLVFRRSGEAGEAFAVFNAGRESATVEFPAGGESLVDVLDGHEVSLQDGIASITLPARSAAIVVRN